jgi:hypothetical protein
MAGLLKVRAVHVRRCSAAQEVGVLAAVNALKLGLNLLQSRPSHVSTIWIMDPLTDPSMSALSHSTHVQQPRQGG